MENQIVECLQILRDARQTISNKIDQREMVDFFPGIDCVDLNKFHELISDLEVKVDSLKNQNQLEEIEKRDAEKRILETSKKNI